MAKQLKDILKQAHDRIKGVHSSQTVDASLGKDPGVDYDPKSGDEQDFVAKHSVQKWDEPYGNPNYADSVKHSLAGEKKHGYKKPEDKKVNESKKAEDVKCNHTPAKTWCPVHEMADCSMSKNIREEVEQIDELSSATYKRAMNKAGNKAMWLSSAGKDNPAYKKRYAQAKKFQAKGIEQEKKEKAVKEDIELDEVVVTRKMTPQEKAARAAYLKKHSEKVAGHDTGVAPKKSFKDVNTERGDYTSQPSKMGIRHAMASGYYKNEEVEQVNEVSKRTIASYVDKAEKSSRDLEGKNDNKSWRKMHKRDDSVLMAKDKWAGKRKVAATEEVEQVDEISKDLAKSYIRKASDQVDNTYEYHGDKKTTKKLDNREVGIRTASMKKNASKYVKVPATEEVVSEVLTKSTTAGETISDFVHSKNPKFAGKSKEKRKQMALAAYYAKQRNEETVQECGYPVQPLIGGMDQPPRGGSDEAAEMVKSELKALSNKAMHLVTQMPDNMHVEPWVQAKIATAKELVSSVHDYMIYGDHDKEQEKETMDTPMTFPNMSVDVNTGQNV
jgi:hypothetical protein